MLTEGPGRGWSRPACAHAQQEIGADTLSLFFTISHMATVVKGREEREGQLHILWLRLAARRSRPSGLLARTAKEAVMARDIGDAETKTSKSAGYDMWGPVDRELRQRTTQALTDPIEPSARGRVTDKPGPPVGGGLRESWVWATRKESGYGPGLGFRPRRGSALSLFFLLLFQFWLSL